MSLHLLLAERLARLSTTCWLLLEGWAQWQDLTSQQAWPPMPQLLRQDLQHAAPKHPSVSIGCLIALCLHACLWIAIAADRHNSLLGKTPSECLSSPMVHGLSPHPERHTYRCCADGQKVHSTDYDAGQQWISFKQNGAQEAIFPHAAADVAVLQLVKAKSLHQVISTVMKRPKKHGEVHSNTCERCSVNLEP